MSQVRLETGVRFGSFFDGLNIFITGHSGFGGLWLSEMLVKFGALVTGYSNELIDSRNPFRMEGLKRKILEIQGDVRDFKTLQDALISIQPEIIFHLAAQPLVLKSFEDPYTTFTTNVQGVNNLINSAFEIKNLKCLILVTTDKVYKHKPSQTAYSENDQLGGSNDPYSVSKAMAEYLAWSTFASRRRDALPFGFATARPGNWLGGGDFTVSRIVPDTIASIVNGESIKSRHPNYRRPWHYILDSILGMMILAEHLVKSPEKYTGPWNFGPSGKEIQTTRFLIKSLASFWGLKDAKIIRVEHGHKEDNSINIKTDKARNKLKWSPVLTLDEAIEFTVKWYKDFHQAFSNSKLPDMDEVYKKQIDEFLVKKSQVT